jgi:hypothetical protein
MRTATLDTAVFKNEVGEVKRNANSIPRDALQNITISPFPEVSAYLEKASKRTTKYVRKLNAKRK